MRRLATILMAGMAIAACSGEAAAPTDAADDAPAYAAPPVATDGGGAEGPDVASRVESYLFSLAWTSHQSTNLFTNQDAHGTGRPITTGGTCSVIRSTVESQPQLEQLLGLTGVLTDPNVCGPK